MSSLRAAASTIGLKALPGCRLASSGRLNPSACPASARMAPLWGSTVTTAAEGSSGSERTSSEDSTAARWSSGLSVLQRDALGLAHLLGGDHALLLHQPQHRVAALRGMLGAFGLARREIGRWRVEEARERGGLREGEVFRALVEVPLGRHLRSVGAVSEVHGVQVGGQDLLLRVVPLVGEGERRLDEAPPERDVEPLVLGDEEVLHELLGYRRAPLLHVPGPQVSPRGPHDALGVHPQVVVEAPVLDSDDRPWKVLAEVLEAHGLAALLHPELPDPVPVGVVDVGVLHQLGVPAVEALPIITDYEKVQADQRYQGDNGQDEGEVE